MMEGLVPVFPDPNSADERGVVAVGGDLSASTLLEAYSKGIFPWFSETDPEPIWWSPPYRMVLKPGTHRVSHSMRPYLKKYTFTLDTAFEEVIRRCQQKSRKGQSGTWITDDMVKAYCHLHELGFAHSAEAWHEGKLAGGLYGVSIGQIFCGESMFSDMTNASKFCFFKLSEFLEEGGFHILDCQNYSEHLESLGCVLITRENYLEVLRECLHFPSARGNWSGLVGDVG